MLKLAESQTISGPAQLHEGKLTKSLKMQIKQQKNQNMQTKQFIYSYLQLFLVVIFNSLLHESTFWHCFQPHHNEN